ncbi:hypothetical protein Q4E93_18050 [Flavitalea sp. BT771]|uniref:hypothetical protein n=1 Tax=Flavitalea sp. BT771 TaxID=3063329 RepID=UPI0026E30041|nr:hypothetical protein [Flavitalea sp. BT771]MDO6432513.1 hypothetical protein [Flavitalea sp. BT771]MDV6221422.1 hypothetical protein [Flavitalea sp. BT771]
MSLFRTIQWKALLMLTVFAANFLVVCHCSARAAAPHQSCCSKAENKPPCKDDKGCSGMHAVKFNLKEKQASAKIDVQPLYAIVHTHDWVIASSAGHDIRKSFRHRWPPRYSPPDLLSLYQCFLI